MKPPEVRYAWNADVAIAYAIVGDAPLDLVYIQGFVSDVELMWEHPDTARFLESLGSFARLIVVDRRGVGLSDRFGPDRLPPLEVAVDDIRAVLDAAGSPSASIFGHHEGGQLGAMFAATHPDLVDRLILYSTPINIVQHFAEFWEEENQIDSIDAEWRRWQREWGTHANDAGLFDQLAPSRRGDAELAKFLSRLYRHAASPSSSAGFYRLLMETDISGVLPTISVPTLVLHRKGDNVTPAAIGPRTAEAIPGGRFVELDGDDWWPFLGDVDALIAEVRAFVTGSALEPVRERILATVLFTDIVDSTAQSAALGDHAWGELGTRHDRAIRANLARYRGREIKTMGDGFLATFDGPARGVRCAESIVAAMKPLGIEIRAGLHTGEVALQGEDIAGLGVAIGARVGALAGPSEVLVSQTVKDLVAGSGIEFEARGEHELKGVPGTWRLYRVTDAVR